MFNRFQLLYCNIDSEKGLLIYVLIADRCRNCLVISPKNLNMREHLYCSKFKFSSFFVAFYINYNLKC